MTRLRGSVLDAGKALRKFLSVACRLSEMSCFCESVGLIASRNAANAWAVVSATTDRPGIAATRRQFASLPFAKRGKR